MTIVNKIVNHYYLNGDLSMAFDTRVEAFEYGSQEKRLKMVPGREIGEAMEDGIRDGSESEESADEDE